MRLLFDANVSPRLVRAVQDVFPGATHVFECGDIFDDDGLIWGFAKANGFTIVTKDGDFQGLSLVRGAPPKVVWLRVGNADTQALERVLRDNVGNLL
jgi:predicted nuclease of predicted toxin-antitoxin system